MKKLLILLIAPFIYAQNITTQDPFDKFDEVFKLQMKKMIELEKSIDDMFKIFESDNPIEFKAPRIVNSGGVISSGLQDRGKYYEVVINSGNSTDSQIKVEVKDNILNVSVTTKKEIEQKTKIGTVKSFSTSSFTQSFSLPKDADGEKVDYSVKDGKIIVKIPKKM